MSSTVVTMGLVKSWLVWKKHVRGFDRNKIVWFPMWTNRVNPKNTTKTFQQETFLLSIGIGIISRKGRARAWRNCSHDLTFLTTWKRYIYIFCLSAFVKPATMCKKECLPSIHCRGYKLLLITTYRWYCLKKNHKIYEIVTKNTDKD